MRDIVEKVVEFFSNKLQADTCDKKKALVDEFMTAVAGATNALPPLIPVPKKVVKKRETSVASKASSASASRASSECGGKCAYVIKKKTGDEVCDRKAKNELDGKFYCGSVDKAGHYQSTIKKLVKKPSAAPSVTKPPGGASTTSSVAATSLGSGGGTSPGAQSLLHKLQQQRNEKNVAYKIPGTEFFIIREKRILMNIKLNEAYGILAEDNKTVSPLDSAAIAYLKEKNIAFTTLVKDDDDEDAEVIEDDEADEGEEVEEEGTEEEDE
jgi:hypothetical protein